jgi:hypothetical protein
MQTGFLKLNVMANVLLLSLLSLINDLHLLKIQCAYALISEHSYDKDNFAEMFDFGSGIFAAVLFALSLIAYKNRRSNRLLFVAAAFELFSIRTIVSRLDIFIPETLELILAMMTFAALSLFFVAIVTRKKIKIKTAYSK